MPRRAKIEEFTDRFVRTAAVGEHTERRSRGFTLRVTKEGVRRFSIRYLADNGEQRRLQLGEYPALSLSAAREAADDALVRIRKGEDVAAERRRAKAAARSQHVRTIADLWADYEAHQQSRVRPSTLEHAQGLYGRYLKKPWGGLRVGDVGKPQARVLLAGLERKGVRVTRNRVRALVAALFKHAKHEVGLLVEDPVAGVKNLREAPRHRVLTDDEMRALWHALNDPAAARAPISPRTALALQLCAVTLQRRGEVVGIDESELNLAEATWTLPAERAKNHKPHVIPLSALAVNLIKQAQQINGGAQERGPLFPSPIGGALDPHALSTAMRRLCAEGGLNIADAHVHDLRRTGATLLCSERGGVSRFIVSRCLNHTSDTGGGAFITASTYAVSDELPRKRHALNAWADLLVSIVEGQERPSNVVPLEARA